MLGAKALAQGKKGTRAATHTVGARCPVDLYKRVEAGLEEGETMTDTVLSSLKDRVDIREETGERMRELRAAKEMEGISLGKMLARLALEALDARKKGKR